MELIENFDINLENSVVTIGTFDGVHLGHRKIIELLNKSASRIGGKSVVISFRTHPRKVLGKSDLKLLTPGEEKIELLEKAGVDLLIYTDFTKEIARMTAVEFTEKILMQKLHVRHLIVGFNHRFGKDRGGDYATLVRMRSKYSFEVIQAPPVYLGDKPVSSTLIREALARGDVKLANSMLGYDYFLYGKVIEGDRLGRKIGFPTANLAVNPEKLMPKVGVYLVRVTVDQKNYYGLLNYGFKPTVGGKLEAVAEVHILDFNKDIYGQKIKVEFIERIRDEKKFSSLNELKRQIINDLNQTMTFLRKL